MKMNDIQRLLQKYQEGTLTPEEHAELDRLTHKEEVLAEAFHRADGIVFRRRIRNLSLALGGLVLLGAGVWMLTPRGAGEAPLVAEAVVEEPAAIEIPQTETLAATAAVKTAVADEPVQLAASSMPEPVKAVAQPDATVKTTPPTPASEQQNVVVCNTQCEADSVISNIWKFLSA